MIGMEKTTGTDPGSKWALLSPDQCAKLAGQVKDGILRKELQRLAQCTADQWKVKLFEQILDKGGSVMRKGVDEYKCIQEEEEEELDRRITSFTAVKEALEVIKGRVGEKIKRVNLMLFEEMAKEEGAMGVKEMEEKIGARVDKTLGKAAVTLKGKSFVDIAKEGRVALKGAWTRPGPSPKPVSKKWADFERETEEVPILVVCEQTDVPYSQIHSSMGTFF